MLTNFLFYFFLVLDNVLSFDSFDIELQKTLFEIFLKHGIPISSKLLSKMSATSTLSEEQNNCDSKKSAFILVPKPYTNLFSSKFTDSIELNKFLPPSHLKPIENEVGEKEIVPISFQSQHISKFSEEKKSFFVQKNISFGFPVTMKADPSEDNKLYLLTVSPFDLYMIDLNDSLIETRKMNLTCKIVNYCHSESFEPFPSMTFFQDFILVLISQFSALLVIDRVHFKCIEVLSIPGENNEKIYNDYKVANERLCFVDTPSKEYLLIVSTNGRRISLLTFKENRFFISSSTLDQGNLISSANLIFPDHLMFIIHDKKFKSSFQYISKLENLSQMRNGIEFRLVEIAPTEEASEFPSSNNYLATQQFTITGIEENTFQSVQTIRNQSNVKQYFHIFVPTKKGTDIVANLWYGMFSPPKQKIYHEQISEQHTITERKSEEKNKVFHNISIYLKLSNLLCIVSQNDSEIFLKVYDFTSKYVKSRKIMIAQKYGDKSSKNSFRSTDGNNFDSNFARNSVPFIILLEETKRGTLIALHEDGTFREFELRLALLQKEEKEWKKMLGVHENENENDSGKILKDEKDSFSDLFKVKNNSNGQGGEGDYQFLFLFLSSFSFSFII